MKDKGCFYDSCKKCQSMAYTNIYIPKLQSTALHITTLHYTSPNITTMLNCIIFTTRPNKLYHGHKFLTVKSGPLSRTLKILDGLLNQLFNKHQIRDLELNKK